MTSKTLLSKLKTKFILALIIVGLLCTSLFFLSACSEETEKSEIPSYSYTDTDDGLISNPNFNYNTSSIELKNYPQTSPTGWSRAKDTNGFSSSAKSGVIDVSEEGWKELLNNIYTDTYYLQYLENKLGFSKSDIENDNENLSAEERKAKVVEKYSSILTRPELKEGTTDNKVYMLNNYTSKINFGASQKITSSKAITINKGEFVAITVDVFTQNIKVNNNVTLGMTGANAKNGDEFGASIRLTNTFNSSSQAEYAITNINTNGKWETYTIYAKGDTEFDCSVTLALGLGYSDKYPTEGTVYFDNIKVEKLETVDVSAIPSDAQATLTYGETEAQPIQAGENKAFFYDMTLKTKYLDESTSPATEKEYFSEIDLALATIGGTITTLNGDGTKPTTTLAPTIDTTNKTITVADLNSASYTLKLESNQFVVAPQNYAYVSFKLDNKLNKLSSTSVTVDVWENTAGYEENKMPAVVSITETGETTVGLMIKNNFSIKDYAGADRTFYLSIVIGPTNLSTSDKQSDYANDDVIISDLKIANGETYQYIKGSAPDYEPTETETYSYKFYQLFNGVAKGSTSLYADLDSDYSSTETTTTSKGFGVEAVQKGKITSQPVSPSEYSGVVSNHIFLTNKEGAESNTNTRAIKGTTGSFAGVVDTKYAANYTGFNLNALGSEKDIRPLMIYNDSADSYGFINNKAAQVVSANSFAKVSVKVKVDDTAKAFIYLVDTTTKEIMTFDKFKPNSTGLDSIPTSEQVEKGGNEFIFTVDNTNGEWVDVVFYIATGKTEKSFRVELWNGSRDGNNKSSGYVFFKSVEVSLTSAFTEPSKFEDSFLNASSPLYAKEVEFKGDNGEYLCYSRPLTDIEKEFNEDYPDNAVSYSPKIIWAKSNDTIYAIFNTIDVEAINPYDSITEEDTEKGSGCAAETDPATFWLSFSSILLAVVLVLAIVMLFVKNIRRRRKANASDAKSHYTVKSRVRKAPKASKKQATTEKDEIIEEDIEENEDIDQVEAEESVEEVIEENQEADQTEETKEQTLDDYVYGDVQDFGEEGEKN